MKTRIISNHHELLHGQQTTSFVVAIISIVKFIIVVVGVALMVFE